MPENTPDRPLRHRVRPSGGGDVLVVDAAVCPAMEPAIRRLPSGAPWEPLIGYSRVVVAGPLIFVAGTTATVDGAVVGAGDAYAQTIQAFRNVETALASAGATLADVVQTQLFVVDISRWEEVGRAHRELFATIMPVTAMVGVAALIDPEMLVEVQAIAYRERA